MLKKLLKNVLAVMSAVAVTSLAGSLSDRYISLEMATTLVDWTAYVSYLAFCFLFGWGLGSKTK